MPIYIFRNSETNEYREIVQRMNEPHEYFGDHGDEDVWVRVFTCPNASIDAKIDPFKPQDFLRKTESKKGTFGDFLDKSSELSSERASLAGGKDPVKDKYFDDYSAKRNGAKHPQQQKSFENSNIKVEF